jgi:hypothetical protein
MWTEVRRTAQHICQRWIHDGTCTDCNGEREALHDMLAGMSSTYVDAKIAGVYCTSHHSDRKVPNEEEWWRITGFTQIMQKERAETREKEDKREHKVEASIICEYCEKEEGNMENCGADPVHHMICDACWDIHGCPECPIICD